MKKLFIVACPITALFILMGHGAICQNWAGPDTMICQGQGAVLGLESAPNDYCYSWSPATGLSSTSDKRPTAKPPNTTIYTLTATGPDFSNRVVDQVKVTVALGGITLSPSYTDGDSTMNQAAAHLSHRPPGTTIVWSLGEPDLGCDIDPQSGKISYCHLDGTVMVKASVDGDEDCFAEAPFDVNAGVKRVWAIDTAHSNRRASNGGTLHLLGHNAVQIKAEPNTGESFPENQPDWTGSTVLPPDPNDDDWIHDSGTPSTMFLTAGGKSVNVERHQPVEGTLGSLSHTFGTVVTYLAEKLKPSEEMTQGFSYEEYQTTACVPLDMGLDHNFSVKVTDVEKFASPMLGLKTAMEGELNASLTAKICFPPPYSSPPNPLFMYSTYVFGSGTVKLNAGISKDESKAVNPQWEVDSLNFSGEIKLGVGGEAGLTIPPNDIFGIVGSVAGEVIIGLDPTFTTQHVKTVVKLEPLVIEGSFKVFWMNPDNTVIELAGKYNLLDPIESQPFLTLDLSGL